MTVTNSSKAIGTTVDGGTLDLYDDAVAQDSTVKNGVMTVTNSAKAIRTRVNDGGVIVLGNGVEAIDTTIHQGGELNLRGNAALSGNNQLDGVVRFARVVDSFHTLTIDDPLSGNGHFVMNTDLASRQGDSLKLHGAVSGNHTLVVADSGADPVGAAQSLMLVDGNGGDGNFNLFGNTVDAGAYRFQLQQEGNDWYLASRGCTEFC
ncbi:outer membrane autotransporter barrel domain-containing protein, partial [Pseudomonas sp. GM21]|uniref:pertactin-like passenger domain-containing protein n=1 Tax=Pseudomonas sp. GM21 TaxID=1144325 RepID=UPI0002723568